MRIMVLLVCVFACGCREPEVQQPQAKPPERERTLLEHTVATAQRMKDTRFRAELLAELAVAHASTSSASARAPELLASALEVAKSLSSPDDRELAMSKVAIAHADVDQYDAALELAGQLRSPEQKSIALARIAVAVARDGEIDRAASIAGSISLEDHRGEAYAAAARAAARAKQFKKAAELARKCPRPQQRAEALAAISRAYTSERKLKEALKTADTIESGHFKSEAQEAIVEQYYRIGQRGKAENLAQAIESSWISSRAYARMAQIASGGGNHGAGRKLFDRAQEIAEGIHDPIMRGSALEDLAMHAIRAGNDKLVRELADKCPTKDAKNRIYAKLIVHKARIGKVDDARELLAQLGGDPIPTADAVSAIAHALAGAGNEEPALELVGTIANVQLRLPVIAKIAVGQELRRSPVTSASLYYLARALEAEDPTSAAR